MKIIIIPGNGDTRIEEHNWYAWLRDQLLAKGIEVIAENMPDPVLAHKDIWLPHIENVFKADEETIIVGHSSGGVAGLRYLEAHKLKGLVAIGVNYTDLGYKEEAESGYYDTLWEWQKIKQNAEWIMQFCSQDDPYIPIDQPRFIHEQLSSEYHEYTDKGHFGSPDRDMKKCPEILEILLQKINAE